MEINKQILLLTYFDNCDFYVLKMGPNLDLGVSIDLNPENIFMAVFIDLLIYHWTLLSSAVQVRSLYYTYISIQRSRTRVNLHLWKSSTYCQSRNTSVQSTMLEKHLRYINVTKELACKSNVMEPNLNEVALCIFTNFNLSKTVSFWKPFEIRNPNANSQNFGHIVLCNFFFLLVHFLFFQSHMYSTREST